KFKIDIWYKNDRDWPAKPRPTDGPTVKWPAKFLKYREVAGRSAHGWPPPVNGLSVCRPPHGRSVSLPATTRSVRQFAGHHTVGPSVCRPPHGRSVSWPATTRSANN
ncbi:hypothetical protein BpHYR1_028494, partial [Brachionus plicatilis]